jgi:prepilin-type N-terminal cleavage/methylation domain-containing protein
VRQGGIQGFTLLELLICLAITALLASLVFVPTYQGLLDRVVLASFSQMVSDLEQHHALAVFDARIYEYHLRESGVYIYNPVNNVLGGTVEYLAWPRGVKRDTDFTNQDTNYILQPDGTLKITQGRTDLRFIIRGKIKVKLMVTKDGITLE